MSDLLDHLSKDTLPADLVAEFLKWCVWGQARPALLTVLEKTGLMDEAETLRVVNDYNHLARVSQRIGEQAHEARQRTGPLGLSTAEATAFLVHRLALAAMESDFDPEGVAFFTAQVVGWAAFAEAGFADPARKASAEREARASQEAQLAQLWREHR